jgi:hypothetical protein
MLACSLLQEDEVAKVGLSRYAKVSRSAFGLNGKKRIAVLRAGGAILGERGGLESFQTGRLCARKFLDSKTVCQHEQRRCRMWVARLCVCRQRLCASVAAI